MFVRICDGKPDKKPRLPACIAFRAVHVINKMVLKNVVVRFQLKPRRTADDVEQLADRCFRVDFLLAVVDIPAGRRTSPGDGGDRSASCPASLERIHLANRAFHLH